MAINIIEKPEDTRPLLDSSTPGLVLSTSPASHYGIGGSANTWRHSESETKEAQENNERVRRASLRSLDRNNNAKFERTNSVADSIRDFVGRKNSKTH